ncbi:MAG: outer membrane beta-barrel protein [Bacteroidota bacterium]
MKNTVLLFALLLVTSFSASAQFYTGVNAGWTSALLADEDSFNDQNRVSWSLGVDFGYKFSNRHAIQYSTVYVRKGESYELSENELLNFKLNYLQQELMLRLSLPVDHEDFGVYWGIGPYAALPIPDTHVSTLTIGEEEREIERLPTKTDFGIKSTFGVDFKYFAVDFQYQIGLTNAFTVRDGRNQLFGLVFSLPIRFGDVVE